MFKRMGATGSDVFVEEEGGTDEVGGADEEVVVLTTGFENDVLRSVAFMGAVMASVVFAEENEDDSDVALVLEVALRLEAASMLEVALNDVAVVFAAEPESVGGEVVSLVELVVLEGMMKTVVALEGRTNTVVALEPTTVTIVVALTTPVWFLPTE